MYKKHEHIHFVGIGGIGMSGLARILATQGYRISGCDKAITPAHQQELEAVGCTIYENHDESHVHDTDVMVYSSALNTQHPELIAATTRAIPLIPRALMLAEIMRTKFSVAVTGAHGKTTTTSLIAHIMVEAERNPTIIIGGKLKSIATNAQLGQSDLLIAEADESDRSLLYLNPTMAVITNIDAEHLDTYTDIQDIKATFKNFLERLPFYGKAFVWADDPHIQALLPLPHISITTFGFSQHAHAQAEIIQLAPTHSTFNVSMKKPGHPAVLLGQATVALPGEHNVLNALAALTLCLEFEVPFTTIQRALATFTGVERRFEYKGLFNGAEVFDDYAHHPTEIYHTLITGQRRKKGKMHVIFQPHRYSRTAKLWQEFIDVFSKQSNPYVIDFLYIVDIYPASEEPIDGITSERFAQELQNYSTHYPIFYVGSYDQAEAFVRTRSHENDLIITVGAGKVYCVGERLVTLSYPAPNQTKIDKI